MCNCEWRPWHSCATQKIDPNKSWDSCGIRSIKPHCLNEGMELHVCSYIGNPLYRRRRSDVIFCKAPGQLLSQRTVTETPKTGRKLTNYAALNGINVAIRENGYYYTPWSLWKIIQFISSHFKLRNGWCIDRVWYSSWLGLLFYGVYFEFSIWVIINITLETICDTRNFVPDLWIACICCVPI